MGLARKGLRRLSVDGRKYAWTVSPDSDYMVVVVEAFPEGGARLEAYTDYGPVDGQQRVISPSYVAEVIRAALADGWQPLAAGSPYRFDAVDELPGLKQADEQRVATDC